MIAPCLSFIFVCLWNNLFKFSGVRFGNTTIVQQCWCPWHCCTLDQYVLCKIGIRWLARPHYSAEGLLKCMTMNFCNWHQQQFWLKLGSISIVGVTFWCCCRDIKVIKEIHPSTTAPNRLWCSTIVCFVSPWGIFCGFALNSRIVPTFKRCCYYRTNQDYSA